MSEKKSTYDGYKPNNIIEKGYQPKSTPKSNPNAGHQPTTVGQGGNTKPPKSE